MARLLLSVETISAALLAGTHSDGEEESVRVKEENEKKGETELEGAGAGK